MGAGPAGSTLGYKLSRAGLRALILEKETFPRYKPCGGGLNVRTVDILDFDVSSVVEDTITAVRITYRMGEPFTNRSDRPITYTVSRERFDHLLLQRAIAAGCTVHEGEKVRAVAARAEGVAVRSGRQTYSGGAVVGADGANGVVARSTGLMRDAWVGMACRGARVGPAGGGRPMGRLHRPAIGGRGWLGGYRPQEHGLQREWLDW